MIRSNEGLIYSALLRDLRKGELEAYAGELGPLYGEIDFALRHLEKWTKTRAVSTEDWKLGHLLGQSEIRVEPRGKVLIIAPWNYPIYLALAPVVGALAAGNSITLKPSEFALSCSEVLSQLVEKYFSPNVFSCVTGGVEEAKRLTELKWDFIFYTGGPRAAREIYMSAAKNLTPVVLELGGKSPAIFDFNVPFDVSLKRLLWGKFFNAGQTCVAPDYVLVPEVRASTFIDLAKKTIREFYGEQPETSVDYGRIINEAHIDRLVGYLANHHIVEGGHYDRVQKFLTPTLVLNPTLESPLMQEEIFGPILPILTYTHLDDAISIMTKREKPLALYIFSNDTNFQNTILRRVQSGGVCINDCLVHLTNPNLPFGGIGESGVGAYHGYESFRIFSHFRAVERKPLWADLSLRYPPYKLKLNRVLKWFV